MNENNIEKTSSSPKIILQKMSEQSYIITIEGESYPEDANKFYKPIIDSLLQIRNENFNVDITFDLSYFNSSSTMQILDIFDILAKPSKGIVFLTWWCAKDDEDSKEAIEELIADYNFNKKIMVK